MSGNGPLFRVSISGVVAQESKRLAKVASSMGIKAKFMSSLTAIHQRLRNDPLGFGEERYQTKNPN